MKKENFELFMGCPPDYCRRFFVYGFLFLYPASDLCILPIQPFLCVRAIFYTMREKNLSMRVMRAF